MCRDNRCSCFSKPGLRVTIASQDGRAAMRWCVSIGAVLFAGAMAGGDIAGIAAPNPRDQAGPPMSEKPPSGDIQLGLAVDVSHSIGIGGTAVQRQGHG